MALTKTSYSMISGAVLNVFDYMTPAQISAVENREVVDVHAPLQAALDDATIPGTSSGKGVSVFLPAGVYYISSTLSIPNATVFFGAGRQQTAIWALPGFTGVMITDKGNAGKIFLRDFRVDGFGRPGITDIIKMGYGTTPLGQAEWFNLFVYAGTVAEGALATANCINVVTNVTSFAEIETGYGGYGFVLGPGSTVSTFDRCFSGAAVYGDFDTYGETNIVNCEIEAPAATSVPIYVRNSVNITNLTFSQSNVGSVINPYIVRTDPSAQMVNINGLVHFNGGNAATLTTVVSDQRVGYPPFWGDPGGAEREVSVLGNNVFTKDLYILNLQRQVFKFQLFTNSGGDIFHRITSQFDNTIASSFVGKINGASINSVLTPTGPNATTAFASGAKISSANTNTIVLHTDAQQYLEWASGTATIGKNEFGTALNVEVGTQVLNINGQTKNYIVLQFFNAATGAAFDLTSITGTPNKLLNINCEIYIA